MRRRLCTLLTPAVLLWGAAGCGSETPAEPGKGVDAGAAVLRAELTALLVDHAHLTGLALVQARRAATAPVAPAAGTVAAEDTLVQSAAALGDAVANARGTAAGSRVLQALRRYDERLLEAARAAAAGQPVRPGRIAAARAATAEAFAAAAPELRPRSAASALARGDAVRRAAGSPALADRIGDYAGRMPVLGEQLATAIVDADDRDRFDGDPGAGAAELRSAFNAVLLDHVHGLSLAALLSQGEGGGDAAAAARARAAVDATAVALGDLVGSVYGQDAGAQVRALWRELQAGFAAYTRAKTTEQDAPAELALGSLDATAGELADVLAATVPTLRRAEVLQQLEGHIAATTGAIRAIASGSPKLAARVQAAAGQVLSPARTLSAAIQRDRPGKFPTG